MLSLLPYVAARPDGVSIADLCERFAVTPARLRDDLEVVMFVGVAPYTPDLLVELVISDDRVVVQLPQAFDRPLQLTPDEAASLVLAGRSLLAVPGADPDGPLARGLAKLAEVLQLDPDQIDIDLGEVEAGDLEALRTALEDHRRVELDYYAYGRDERATRVVDPYRLVHDQGHWYLSAHCHQAEAERLFRLDRMESVRLLDQTFVPPPDLPPGAGFRAGPQDPRVVLELDATAAWVADQYPTEDRQDLADGGRRVTLVVAARPWLDRLLVRLGPHARVVGGDRELADRGREAARRILARYADG
jgi:proteasome accessory factor C